jgi:hypothetical protein
VTAKITSTGESVETRICDIGIAMIHSKSYYYSILVTVASAAGCQIRGSDYACPSIEKAMALPSLFEGGFVYFANPDIKLQACQSRSIKLWRSYLKGLLEYALVC